MKTYYLPSDNRRITLRVSAKGIKVIDRDGIEAVVARLRTDSPRLSSRAKRAHRPAQRESGEHDRVVPIRFDVTKPDDVRAAASRCADVTVLINNAWRDAAYAVAGGV